MFYIRIADLNVKIDNKYPHVQRLCAEYVIGVPECVDIEASASEAEIDKEIAESAFEHRGFAESACIYRNICKDLPKKFNAYLFHSALIEYEGRGYAFAAKSGMGKSTHISLWKKLFGDGVRVINGDKPIVRYIDGKLLAYGTPWCGKEGLGINASVPLNAICFIERDKDNSITRVSSADAVSKLFSQVLMPDDAENLDSLLALLDSTLDSVSCYILKCNTDTDAARVACEGMRE